MLEELQPWTGDRFEYGEIHEVIFRVLGRDAVRQVLVVLREANDDKFAPDPNIIALLNRLGAVGWVISDATRHGVDGVDWNHFITALAREHSNAEAGPVVSWRSRFMTRRLPPTD